MLACLLGGAWYLENPRLHTTETRERITVGLEKPGVTIQQVTVDGLMTPAPHHLEVSLPRGTRKLTDLNQLRGLVTIRTPAEALLYVRLRTATAWNGEWGRGPFLCEIVPSSELPHLPAFGDHDYQRELKAPFDRKWSGSEGQLTPAAFRMGHFSLPVVSRMGAGFCVQRWIYSENFHTGAWKRLELVELVRETVGPDGEYHQAVIKSKPPPSLYGSDWGIPASF
jgi:hypothetical protein